MVERSKCRYLDGEFSLFRIDRLSADICLALARVPGLLGRNEQGQLATEVRTQIYANHVHFSVHFTSDTAPAVSDVKLTLKWTCCTPVYAEV